VDNGSCKLLLTRYAVTVYIASVGVIDLDSVLLYRKMQHGHPVTLGAVE